MKKISLSVLFLLAINIVAICQKREISGKVTDKNTGAPLEGVNVLIEKSKSGTTTQKDGTFTISAKANKVTLIFSSIGYATQALQVDKNTDNVNIAMSPSSTDNSEVVVIGYGTQKRGDVTGAITKYKNDRLDESPVARLDQALQGKIAGVQIENISSEAGSDPKISIRGISSINAGMEPLVVVDGQPMADGLANVNMADVESVEVLKDAASAAIYGSRGASGVILITTKSGKADKVKYNFKYSIGAKQAYKRYNMMTTSEYVNRLFYEQNLQQNDPQNIMPSVSATNNEKAAYVVENDLLNGNGTDWQSQGLRTGLFQNIQLSATGGKSDFKYYLSGGYQQDQGMMRNSELEKYNARAKLDFTLSKRVKLVINIAPSYTRKESPSVNYTTFARYPSFMPVYHTDATINLVHQNSQWQNLQTGDYAQPRHFNNLFYQGYLPNGVLWSNSGADPFSSSTNSPVSILDNTEIYLKDYRLQGSAELTYKIINGLDFKSSVTSYMNYSNGLNWANANAERDGTFSKGTFTNNNTIDALVEETVNYTKSYKDHSFNALFGFTTQYTKLEKNQVTGLAFPDDNIRTLNNATLIDKSTTTGSVNQVGLISYLGRLNYSYLSKYLFSASFRTDGSSYFGPGKKWGTFPSVSLGWVVDKEKFMDNIKWVSRLKLRTSYGVSGNNRILDFGFLELLYPANYSFGNGSNNSTGNTTGGQATSPTIRSNSDLTWEQTFQTNIGLDAAFFNNRVSITLDAYKSKTDRLLLQQSAMAFTGVPASWNNIGSLQNTGIEFQINTINVSTPDFKWSTSANISHTENKVLELGQEAYITNEGERNELYRNIVGGPLVQFYGFKTDGIWLSQQEIDAAKAAGLSSPFRDAFNQGQLKIVDVNHDNIIDNNDRTILGNPYPDFTWGITNTLTYKNFDLTFTFQGSQGGKVINGDPNYDEMKKLCTAYNTDRYISPSNPGDGQTPTYNKSGFNWMLTDYVIEDASYFALRETTIGYKIGDFKSSLLSVSAIRLYFTAQNLYYHMAKGYRGLNPEARFTNSTPYNTSLVTGYQRGAFPVNQTFIFGIDLTF